MSVCLLQGLCDPELLEVRPRDRGRPAAGERRGFRQPLGLCSAWCWRVRSHGQLNSGTFVVTSQDARRQASDDGGPFTRVIVPVPSMVLLIGPSGSGKSTFASRHFGKYEVVSSDHCRAMLADSEEDQSVTPEAFELLRFIADARLALGRLTVVDATNVHEAARGRNLALAARRRVPVVAIVFDVSLERCLANNSQRTDRVVDEEVVRRQHDDMTKAVPAVADEVHGAVYRLRDQTVDSVVVVRSALPHLPSGPGLSQPT